MFWTHFTSGDCEQHHGGHPLGDVSVARRRGGGSGASPASLWGSVTVFRDCLSKSKTFNK